MRLSIEQLSDLLDEHIVKGLAKQSKPSKIDQLEVEICKSLTFNPYTPHHMTEDSPYYNPYMMVDGGYAPYPVEYWTDKGQGESGYDTTRKFYSVVGDRPLGELWSQPSRGPSIFSKFKKSIDDMLFKAQAVPIGTVHQYGNGNSYKKMGEGKWVEVAGREKRTSQLLAHPEHGPKIAAELEKRAQKEQAIMAALKQKQREDALVGRAKNEVMQHVVDHTKKVSSHLFEGGKMPKELDQLHKEQAKNFKPDPKDNPDSRVKGLKKELKPKTHHVEVNFTHQGKDYTHRFSNVAAENHGEAIQKVTEGLGKKLPGHVITKIHAETPKQAGGAKPAGAKPEKPNEAKA